MIKLSLSPNYEVNKVAIMASGFINNKTSS